MLKKIIAFFFFGFFLSSLTYGQKKSTDNYNIRKLNDGPFVFIKETELIKKKIVNGKIISENIPLNSYQTTFKPDKSVFTKVRKIAALSDIHGQYDLAVQLLKSNKIIDRKLNWRFGKGHLVIAGDIFDRGPKVHETLLLVYKLEQQAKRKGGKVHFLLGNHEYMVLHNDLRYIHKKYKAISKLLNVSYSTLYGKNTVLGRWLRSKSTIIKINDDYFVHGGISQSFIDKTKFSSETVHQINNTMRTSIDRSKDEMKSTDFYTTYYRSKGLIWYRGYFNDNLKDAEIDHILSQTNSKHIIVGHCSNEEVVQLFNYKIFGVDSSIKRGVNGELLLIKRKKYIRKSLKGKRKAFN